MTIQEKAEAKYPFPEESHWARPADVGKSKARILALRAAYLAGAESGSPKWVKCPKCDGQGSLAKPPWIPGDVNEWTSGTATSYVCDVCNGAKIIASPSPSVNDRIEKLSELETFKDTYIERNEAYNKSCERIEKLKAALREIKKYAIIIEDYLSGKDKKIVKSAVEISFQVDLILNANP